MSIAATALAVSDPAWRDPAWLTAVGGLLVGVLTAMGTLLGIILNRQRRLDARLAVANARAADSADDTRTIRAQVENDHPTNLRDDLDRVHESVLQLTATVIRVEASMKGSEQVLTQVSERVGSVETHVAQLREDASRKDHDDHESHTRIHERITAIEQRFPAL